MTVNGFFALIRRMLLIIPVFVITALINPTFSHRGETVLAYFPNGNPLTAESIFFGLAAGEMLVTVLMWMDCFNGIMTSDKIVYIFGRILPSGSLLVSMTLRFIPRLTKRFGEITQAQRTIGNDIGAKKVLVRIKSVVRSLSVLISWMLENSISASDSMQARGYGTGKRTDYSLFRFTPRDGAVLGAACLLAAVTAFAFSRGAFAFDYYPRMIGARPRAWAYVCYALLYLVPAAVNIKEETVWRLLRSKI